MIKKNREIYGVDILIAATKPICVSRAFTAHDSE